MLTTNAEVEATRAIVKQSMAAHKQQQNCMQWDRQSPKRTKGRTVVYVETTTCYEVQQSGP